MLPEGDRLKGYIRPFRRTYVHSVCDQLTRAPREVGEMFAKEPGYRTHLYCAHCQMYRLVSEFAWKDGAIVGS